MHDTEDKSLLSSTDIAPDSPIYPQFCISQKAHQKSMMKLTIAKFSEDSTSLKFHLLKKHLIWWNSALDNH